MSKKSKTQKRIWDNCRIIAANLGSKYKHTDVYMEWSNLKQKRFISGLLRGDVGKIEWLKERINNRLEKKSANQQARLQREKLKEHLENIQSKTIAPMVWAVRKSDSLKDAIESFDKAIICVYNQVVLTDII